MIYGSWFHWFVAGFVLLCALAIYCLLNLGAWIRAWRVRRELDRWAREQALRRNVLGTFGKRVINGSKEPLEQGDLVVIKEAGRVPKAVAVDHVIHLDGEGSWDDERKS